MKKNLFCFLVVVSVGLFILSSGKSVFCIEGETKTPHQIDELVKMLAAPNPQTKEAAYKELLAIGNRAAPNLLEKAKDWKYAQADQRVACIDLLGELKDQKSVNDLISFLDEKSPRMRYSSARALGRIGNKTAVGPLIDTLMRDSDWEVRKFSAEALGRLKDKKAGDALAGALLNDSSEPVRFECVKALDIIGDRSQAQSVIKGLKDKGPSVRAYSAELLGKWSVKEVTNEIANMLEQDRAYEVRASCATALGALKDKKTLPSLVNALSDEYQQVRVNALDALKKITGKDFGENKAQWQTYITK